MKTQCGQFHVFLGAIDELKDARSVLIYMA